MSTLLVIVFGLLLSLSDAQTPLDDYVNAPDPYYKYVDTGIRESGRTIAGHWNAYLINMTSQMWLNSTYVDRPIWWHWLWIIIPDDVKYLDFATLVGTGNRNSNNWPTKGDEYFLASTYMATHTKTIVAVLYNIPNEPLTFYNDPLHKSRSEDAILAFGWNQFIQMYNEDINNTYRYNWVGHFPMAKATVKAMDTVVDYTQSAQFKDKNYDITRFAAAGASKRGWSTWLTAAVDKRVVVFVPMVMDMPNMWAELHHMWRAYGGWTFAFADYYDENLTQYLDTPAFTDLMYACDPYSYFDRYAGKWKMPIDAVNDEFFMPDDEAFWWTDLPDPKYFQINPDAEHSLSTAIEELVPTLSTFLMLYLEQFDMPKVTWEIANITGNITLTFEGNTSMIVSAHVWHGRSCSNVRRDYRLINLDDPCRCGVSGGGYCINLESLFFPFELKPISMNGDKAVYEAGPPNESNNHWDGHFISLRVKFFDAEHPWMSDFDDGDDRLFLVEYGEMQFTTQVSIMPQTFPYPDCHDAGCYGTLV